MTDNTVISAKAEIQTSAILSEAKDMALRNRNCVGVKKDERDTCGHNS